MPKSLRAGDTISWTESLSDYPASASWVLAISFISPNKSPIIITGTPSGDDHLMEATATISKAWINGLYHWQAYVTKGSERYTVGSGQISILPDLSQATSQTDIRSHAKKTLDLIETVIELKAAGGDVSSYSIAGRSATRYSWEELITLRSKYKAEYDNEVEQDKASKGEDSGRFVGIRFNRI